MDFITFRAGLPPLIIRDHNRDLSMPEDTYARETYEETMKAYDRVETCLARWEAGEENLQKTECGYADLP